MISKPEDYGLSADETLARVAEVEKPTGFDAYWDAWRDEVQSLPVRFHGAVDQAQNEIVIRSKREVRVVGRLSLPAEPPRGVVITTHGYQLPAPAFPSDPEPWTERQGLATLRLRVRGYPPSTLDLPMLGTDWILYHLRSPDDWIVSDAVADVVQAYRVMRHFFGDAMPIALHGESLGGGLAVMAAAQLERLGDRPNRVVLGLPSLGDWRWRHEQYCSGAGGLVNMELASLREEADAIVERLRLHDAAIHAGEVTAPVLAKLAISDDAVPAPSAAAIYNALGCVDKWRFVVRWGHFDGGIADLRRHAAFEALQVAFLDPESSPDEAVHTRETSMEP